MKIGAYSISACGLLPNCWELDGVAQHEPDPAQIEAAAKWIAAKCTPRKTINKRFGSYGLKHRAEDWAGSYITNGAFIVAALQAGYVMQPHGFGSPNGSFNVRVWP